MLDDLQRAYAAYQRALFYLKTLTFQNCGTELVFYMTDMAH